MAETRRRAVTMLLENNPYPQDVRVRNEAEALARAGWEVEVIAPRANGQPPREVLDGVAVRRFRMPPERQTIPGLLAEYLTGTVQLHLYGFAALARGARVVHLHNPPDTLFGAGLAARLLGRRVVFDYHDLAPELVEQKFGESPLVALSRLLERASMRVASVVLAANESHRSVALERGGVAPERVAVVRNGPRERMLEQAVSARLGVLAEPRLVFLGELEAQDGVDELPELLLRLRTLGLDARLTVVGPGSRRGPLERTFARAGLRERVRFTGRVPHAEVPALLASADICVDPAGCSPLNHRSTMVKIAEYLAAARPVVAYQLLETQRTARDAALYAACGDLDAFAHHVARLAGEPELRARLASHAHERARDLTWEHSERELLGAYERLA